MLHALLFASFLTLIVWLIVQKTKPKAPKLPHFKTLEEIRAENQRIRGSPEMKRWRAAVLRRDNYTCQRCGSKDHLEAHHIKPFAYFPALRFDLKNGVTYCHSCHVKTDSYGSKAKLNYGK